MSDSNPSYIPPNPREAKSPGEPVRSLLQPVTYGLIGLCVAVAVFSRLGENKGFLLPLYISLSQFYPALPATFLPEVLQQGQVWRLVTPLFIHYGPFHLLFNMLLLRDLGVVLEQRFGSWRFAGLVFGFGMVSSLVQYVVSSPNFGGMSGAIYGLFGFVWILGRMHPAMLGFTLTQQTITTMLIWFVLCFTGFIGPIANGAHGGGLVVGAALGWIVARRTGAEMFHRRKEFRQAVQKADEEPLHRCQVCGRTEQTAPDLEFRVSGVDGEEYCTEHLPARTGAISG